MPRTSIDGRFIGLMSGTSADAIDAVLVRIDRHHCHLEARHSLPLDDALHDTILALNDSGADEIDRAGALHVQLGERFAEAALALLEQTGLRARDIVAIGSHGQTLRHRPATGFSLQIGSADVIASRTGITTISDFRNRDIALGGQGAPLVPRFHQAMLAQGGERRAVVNLGGMANVTLLNGEQLVAGFDTGPGNVLLDAWCRQHTGARFDRDGAWSRQGQCLPALLERLLAEPYLHQPPPKSTGRELFRMDWLARQLQGNEAPQDVQATLAQFTARTVADAVNAFSPATVLVCGGGVFNTHLLSLLTRLLPGTRVTGTDKAGIDPMAVEASAFAWLAWAHLNRVPGNAPQVTGARQDAVLGACYPA